MASKLLSIALLALLAFSAFAFVAAEDAPGSSESRTPGSGSDDSFQAPERKFEYEVSGSEVKAKAGFYDKDLRVRRGIKIEAKADEEGLRFYARFYNREGDSRSMYSTKFRVRELFEYISASNNTATPYASGDQVPNRISRWAWAAFQLQSAAASSTYARQLSVKTQDGSFEAILKFNMPENGSIALSANDVKIDFNFDNSVLKSKGWLANAAARLALKGTIQTGSALAHKEVQRNSEVEGVSVDAGASGSVSSVEWTNYVMCGTRRVSVAASKLVTETSTRESEDDDDGNSRCNAVYWSILDDQASTPNGKCIWDPTVKIMGSASQSVASLALLVFAALALIFFM